MGSSSRLCLQGLLALTSLSACAPEWAPPSGLAGGHFELAVVRSDAPAPAAGGSVAAAPAVRVNGPVNELLSFTRLGESGPFLTLRTDLEGGVPWPGAAGETRLWQVS